MKMTPSDIYERLEAILEQQYQDGERRQRDEAAIWGGCGGDVKRAVSYAQDILHKPAPNETALAYIQAAISDIEKQRLYYRDVEADEDGYGNGTFREILQAARSIEAQCLPPPGSTSSPDEEQTDFDVESQEHKSKGSLSTKASALLSLVVFALVVFILAQRRL